ncbi:uncharacterized protein HRG_01811 [Hirsutella rhossiliensis]|uniref:DUF2293 domain-containing protein n=1 Tax=Hirsutella rhossiliensis TaxID=111463 RepID=A0A9P8N868_9HYPO|nr:uncharacterized protein HRG_01811 [Hirsutella rhossiliensis]KAH0966402.1 hypothetical protein HRG_01811 [Hirsutella rhossiliensis]
MGTTKRKLPAAAKGVAREKRKRARWPLKGHLDPGSLVAKPLIPRPQSKHHSYFEFVENKDKKKKLHFQNTHDRRPPLECEFLPIGNPELTTACKELSRQRGIQIYIVSDSHFNGITHSYANQMNRVGYHFHKAIVQEARAAIGGLSQQVASVPDGESEPIPESQALYHSQVDAALRDLFPRIPHNDRQTIIQHAFTRDTRSKGEERERVGLQPDVPLARRVQLAVLAHIRHNHTRYDELLKESGWHVARKAVEALCLDVLVKWRGDEETGRDQLDEILREIVVISDSEDDELEQDSTDDDSVVELDPPNDATMPHRSSRQPSRPADPNLLPRRAGPQTPAPLVPPGPSVAADATNQGYSTDRRARRGFQRYRRAWDEAIRRRDDVDHIIPPRDDGGAREQRVENGFSNSHGSQPHLTSPARNGYLAQGLPTYPRRPGNAPAAPPFREAGLRWQRPSNGLQFRDMLAYLSGLMIGWRTFRSTRVCIIAKVEPRLQRIGLSVASTVPLDGE